MISFLSELWFPKKQNSDFHTPDRWWISPQIIQQYGCSIHELYDPKMEYPEEIEW